MKELEWNIGNNNNKSKEPISIACSMVAQQRKQRHMWIGDSGASCHFTNDITGFIKWRHINDEIGVGNSDIAISTKIGTLRLEVIRRNGNRHVVILSDCKYIPNLRNNLFSITRALAKGWEITNQGIKLVLTKNNGEEQGRIIFDTIDATTTGLIMMVCMIPKPIIPFYPENFP
jgi:hypothetical protein